MEFLIKIKNRILATIAALAIVLGPQNLISADADKDDADKDKDEAPEEGKELNR